MEGGFPSFHLVPFHFPHLPNPLFFQAETFCLPGVKLPIQPPNGYLNGEICINQKSMRNVHAAKSHISTRVSDGPDKPLRQGVKKAGDAG